MKKSWVQVSLIFLATLSVYFACSLYTKQFQLALTGRYATTAAMAMICFSITCTLIYIAIFINYPCNKLNHLTKITIFILAIAIFIGTMFCIDIKPSGSWFQSYKNINTNTPYKKVGDEPFSYEFKLTVKSSYYMNILQDIIQEKQKRKRANLIQQANKIRTAYIKIVKSGIGKYDKDIDKKINSYIVTIKEIHADAIKSKTNDYRKTFDIYSGQKEIQQAINIKFTGFKNDTASESAYIEALVPMAIYQLRTHQNDPTLCQVMAKPLSSQNHHLEAQQIAFMQVGNQYCSRCKAPIFITPHK